MIKSISLGVLALSQRSLLVNANKNLRGRDLNATTNQTTLPTPTENSISNMQLREQVPVATRQLNDPTAVALPVVGEIVAFPYDSIPGGFLVCDGGEVSRADYPELFDKLLVSYGPGDSVSTFHLPDLRGQFIRGLDLGSGTDPNAASRTNRGDGTTGSTVGTKQSDATAVNGLSASSSSGSAGSHKHQLALDTYGTGNLCNAIEYRGCSSESDKSYSDHVMTSAGSHSHSISTSLSGNSETRPTNIAMIYAIRAKVTDLSEQFVTINSMATLNSDLTTLDTSLTALNGDVSALSTAHNSLDTSVNDLTNQLTSVLTELNELKKKLE